MRLPPYHPRPHAAGVILAALALLVPTLAGAGACACGGGAPPASPSPQPSEQTATYVEPQAPEPVSSEAPLCRLGEAARFMTPEGAVVRVVVDGYADPGEVSGGATAAAGERLVRLDLKVTVEGEKGTAAVRLPFKKADSFLLIASDDTLYIAQLGKPDLLAAIVAPGKSAGTTLAFALPTATQVIRFVCTPLEGSTPRSATWDLSE